MASGLPTVVLSSAMTATPWHMARCPNAAGGTGIKSPPVSRSAARTLRRRGDASHVAGAPGTQRKHGCAPLPQHRPLRSSRPLPTAGVESLPQRRGWNGGGGGANPAASRHCASNSGGRSGEGACGNGAALPSAVAHACSAASNSESSGGRPGGSSAASGASNGSLSKGGGGGGATPLCTRQPSPIPRSCRCGAARCATSAGGGIGITSCSGAQGGNASMIPAPGGGGGGGSRCA